MHSPDDSTEKQTCPHQGQSDFIPPYPNPRAKRPSVLARLIECRTSWLGQFFEKSYRMKTGLAWLPGKRFFIINQPDLVRQILVENPDNYPKNSVLYHMLTLLLGDGIFISNGKIWKRQRKMMEQAMTLSHIRSVFPLMQEAVVDMLKRLESHRDHQELNISREMAYITADIIFRTIFSKPLTQEESDTIFTSFAEYQNQVARHSAFLYLGIPSRWLHGPLKGPAQRIRQVIHDNVATRFHNIEAGNEDPYDDILNGLLMARDDNGQPFDLEELIDQVAVIFLAGHETSATALSWAFYLIAKCEHLQTAMLEEIQQHKSTPEQLTINYEDIRKLKNTSDVFRETLRLYPPVGGFMKEATQPICMRDKQIKPGDGVVILPWLMHRREDIWPDTHAFKPERFRDPEQKECIRDYYFPYSAGQRVCIGASFANQEAILILSAMVEQFQFIAIEGHDPMPVGHVTIKPETNIRLKLVRRQAPQGCH